jgi:hypothetical protein
MAAPVNFPGSNVVVIDERGTRVSQFTNYDPTLPPKVTVTCWKLSSDEIAEIERTKRVWVLIHGPMPSRLSIGSEEAIREAAADGGAVWKRDEKQ